MVKKDVLVVDDNAGMRYILTVLLTEEGVAVDTCPDGMSALDLSKEQSFKIYVIDYRLPEMRGDAVATELRKLHPDSYIIGYSIEPREKDFLAAGADRFIIKDNLSSELIQSIKDRDRKPAF